LKALRTSLSEIDHAHRKERAADTRALRSGKISAQELQQRNSFIPRDAKVEICDLAAYMKSRTSK